MDNILRWGLTVRYSLPRLSRWAEREERAYILLWAAGLWLGILGVVPIIAVYIAAMITGTYEGDGFPAFTVLSPTLVVPAVILAVIVGMTFTLPLKKPTGLARWEVTSAAFIGMCIYAVALGLDTAFLGDNMGFFAGILLLFYFAVWAVAMLRTVAGWLRLVPAVWRDEDARRAYDKAKAKANSTSRARH